MASYTEWCELEERFWKLHEQEPGLRAYSFEFGSHWRVGGNRGDGHMQFTSLAEGAAVCAGHPNTEGALDWWLDHLKDYLRENRSKNVEVHLDPSSPGEDFIINRVCESSANYCQQWANRARKKKSRQRVGGEDQTAAIAQVLKVIIQEGLVSLPKKVRNRKKPGKEADPKINDRKRIGTKKTSKRAMPEDVAARRALVKAYEKANPNLRGKNLDAETCVDLDARRVAPPPAWVAKYEIKTWQGGYKHTHVKGLIKKMFSVDRKKPL